MMNLYEMKVETTIYSTTKYEEFKFIEYNRPINRKNVENLKISMLKNDLLVPIMINEKGEIIDGQHRFTAWMELGKPIYFYIQSGTGQNEMIELNVNKANWKPSDYLDYFVKVENKNYIRFKQIKEQYGVPISDLLTIVDELSDKQIGENAMGRKFREGNLDMDNESSVTEFLNDLQLFNESENYISTYFIRAFLRLYISDFYESDFLKYRVGLSSIKIQNNKKGYTDEQCEFLAEIYTSTIKNVKIAYDKSTKSFYKLGKQSRRKVV